jgi:nuclear pore complex protein Nup54
MGDQYFFYNVVEPGTTYRYGRPAAANDDVKWAKAVRENPDPNSYVCEPILYVGTTR